MQTQQQRSQAASRLFYLPRDKSTHATLLVPAVLHHQLVLRVKVMALMRTPVVKMLSEFVQLPLRAQKVTLTREVVSVVRCRTLYDKPHYSARRLQKSLVIGDYASNGGHMELSLLLEL